MKHRLTPDTAARFGDIGLGHVRQEYPHKLDHVMDGPEDVQGPKALHPIFHGSFDWHSCVHGYWLLMRVRRVFPHLPVCARIEALADEMLTHAKVAGELDYLDRAYTGGFERPYGWAWLLALHREAALQDRLDWAQALQPLASAFARRFMTYLPKLTYPIRVGTHYNTAFAMVLALDWAQEWHPPLAGLIRLRAAAYYGEDWNCPGWEPGGDEFLSSALIEALCMKQVLAPDRFRIWLDGFLPHLSAGEPRSLFTPALVSDRSDGKIAHLDGFNLCRAWCWRGLADALDPALGEQALATAEAHLDASLPYVAGDYMGAHWLATFALLALEVSPTK